MNINYNSRKIRIFIRYILLLFLVLFFNSYFFEFYISKMYNYISHFFLSFFVNNLIFDNFLLINNEQIFIIARECIGISAYMLISIFFLGVDLNLKDNFKILIYSLFLFTIFNLIRILVLMLGFIYFGKVFFNNLHMLFYEIISVILIILIIFYFIKKYKIVKNYPFYNDIKYLLKLIKK